jgi:hypothetical protein
MHGRNWEHLQRCWVCKPPKLFFTFKFSYLLFCNPTHKLQLRQHIHGKLLITSHLGQSLWWANQKHWPVGKKKFQVNIVVVRQLKTLSTSQRKLSNYAEPKLFWWAKADIFWLYFIQFYSGRSHTEYRWRCFEIAPQEAHKQLPFISLCILRDLP